MESERWFERESELNIKRNSLYIILAIGSKDNVLP